MNTKKVKPYTVSSVCFPFSDAEFPPLADAFFSGVLLRSPRLWCDRLFCLLDLVDQINRFETLQAKQTALQKERAERERKTDALDTFLFELTELDELDMEFSPQRWNAIVDHVTVHSDGRLVFNFQNGSDVIVEIV